MSVERFEEGKTYRHSDGRLFTVGWVPTEPVNGIQLVGYRWTRGGLPDAGYLRLAACTEVAPERHYEVVVRPAVEGDKILDIAGYSYTADELDVGKPRSVIVREWLA